MTIRPKVAALSALIAVAMNAAWVLATPAHAVDQSRGTPGYCPDDKGVTVVIDFGALGGEPMVRCNPQAQRGTGLDALKGAGFQIAGVQRWGESFICRIENRPSPTEKIAITGNEGYRESCIDTPPASGYWSYWHAGNNCQWQYSQWGVKNRDFVAGGFEGWRFSLNAQMDAAPKPRIAPSRPGTDGRACNAPDEPAPTSADPDEKQSASAPQPTPTSARSGDLPAPKPRATATASQPQETVTFNGGQDAPDVVQANQADGLQRFAPWVAGGAIALLLASAVVTSRRRASRHEGR